MQYRICLIYNFAQHYRTNIFMLMDSELPIDFVFGDKYLDVKKMDYSLLRNFKKEVKNITLIRKPIYYQKGILGILKEDYSSYLMLGETICVSTWLMLFLSIFYQKKIYLWTHGWYGKESRLKSFLKRIFFSMADGVFLYGNYAKELMIKEGIKEEKLHVIYNSLDYDKQLSLRKSLKPSRIYFDKFQNYNPNLIFVGRLTEIKRLDLLLFAIQKLNSESKKFNITFVGDGEKQQSLQKLAKELGLEKFVWFYGSTYNEEELSELIYNADLCISPGNVGLTAMHSMAYGTPVITHDDFANQGPEFEAIKDGSTGTFFSNGNIDSLIESISRWFSECPDRESVRKQCYEIIDTKYNPHVQLETFKKYLT
jgi:glycosyltransferase involved in cell wall biosynthesis